MKKTLIIISFFISIFTFAQIEKLSGKWILDKVLYKDGNNLEINSPYYSFFTKRKSLFNISERIKKYKKKREPKFPLLIPSNITIKELG
jgi:hypothetical protein